MNPSDLSAAFSVVAPPQASARATYVAVEGRGSERDDSAARGARERGPTRSQLHAAGHRAAVAALPMPGLMLLALWPLSSWELANRAPAWFAWIWAGAVPLLAAAMLALPRWRARQGRPWPPWFWPLVLGLAAAGLAVLPWTVAPAARPVMAAAAMVWAMVAASALAPWRYLAASLALLPLAAGAGAAAGSGWHWLAAGAFCGAAVLGSVWQRHRGWRRDARRLLSLKARALALETERDSALRSDLDKSRFVAIASHDLRQPVHALGLFAATLQRRLLHTPHEALVRNFLRAVDDLEHSFSSMLDISRLDGGNPPPQLHTFALRDLFRRLQMQYAGQAELSGLGLRFSTGSKWVTSDPQLLERIVGNLVQNALKYTVRGGVVVVARSSATHLNLEVWDTGPGIAAAELPRVFQEFYQLAPGKRDRSHGLGMGLAIVKRLAQLLGHRLEVASTPGRGTMFRIGIAIGELSGVREQVAPEDTRPMLVDSPQMVLIVEDEEAIREGLRVLLQEWGYQTVTAASAAEAEQAVLALEGRVDLVLTDLQLSHQPGAADGIAVVDAVRRLVGHALPALIVTGDTSPQLVQTLAARGDAVLFKPVQPRRLFDAMRAALG